MTLNRASGNVTASPAVTPAPQAIKRKEEVINMDEKLKEQIDSILHSYIIYNLYETVKIDPDLVRDQILNLSDYSPALKGGASRD